MRQRIVILMSVLGIALVILWGRLGYWQLIKGNDIIRQATAMRDHQVQLHEVNRGEILDRNQVPLTNMKTTSALYCFTDVGKNTTQNQTPLADQIRPNEPEATYQEWARVLAPILNQTEAELLAHIEAAAAGRHSLRLADQLDPEQVAQISELHLPGLVVAPLVNRYREDGYCAHLLGYAGIRGDSDGQAGIERAYNNILKGGETAPELVTVFDARGNPIPGLVGKLKNDTDPPGSVVLTIDKRIQDIVEDAIAERMKKGAVVVMDIHSKEILAMASRPTFDPYQVGQIIATDNRSTLTNRALARYNPGSLFKILLSAAALEEGIATPDEMFTCSGKYTFNEFVSMSCWKPEGHGRLTFRQAFANSCNPTFITIGQRLGKDKLLKYVNRFHLTDETIVGFSPGRTGTYVRINPGAPALGNASLGQEGVMISPLEIGSLLSTIADDGYWGAPSIVRYTIGQDGQQNAVPRVEHEQVISATTAAQVQMMLEAVVEQGTGKNAALTETRVAGKTATSQTGQLINEDEEILNTWFAGYLPASEPRWAIVIMVEEGASGAENCAPIFKDISREILKIY